jgi:hypothetical protein
MFRCALTHYIVFVQSAYHEDSCYAGVSIEFINGSSVAATSQDAEVETW